LKVTPMARAKSSYRSMGESAWLPRTTWLQTMAGFGNQSAVHTASPQNQANTQLANMLAPDHSHQG
jgi:hypothetical protein